MWEGSTHTTTGGGGGGCCKLAHSVRLTMVPSHGCTGYGAFTWIHWLWCLHMDTLAMVPSHM